MMKQSITLSGMFIGAAGKFVNKFKLTYIILTRCYRRHNDTRSRLYLVIYVGTSHNGDAASY